MDFEYFFMLSQENRLGDVILQRAFSIVGSPEARLITMRESHTRFF